MSAGIMPDLYRHTARKSTVSKNVKPSNVSMCANNNSTTPYAEYQTKSSNEAIIFDTLGHSIKLEEDVPQRDEPFLLLRDNEMEEMSIGEEPEQTNEEIIYDIMEQMVQLTSDALLPTSNQTRRSLSTTTQDVRHVIDSMINQFNEIDEKEFLSDHIEENVHTSSDEMESDQPTSTASRSQTDDDIVEIEAASNHDSPHLCSCQCHKPHSPLNDEYFLFEQALKQTRLEQQQEKALTNNRLIQTLKRQHEELLSIYRQNQKSDNKTKIDREQQTAKLHLHDSQMQTDMTTMNHTKTSPQQKPMIIPTIISHTNGSLTATRNYPLSGNFNPASSTSSSSSSSQTAPRLAASAVTTTTTAISKTAMVTNSPATTLLPPPLIPTSSHDIVDLTEEDEDDGITRAPTVPPTQSTSSTHPPSSTATPTTAAASLGRPANRTIRPNNPLPNGQAFPLRPLPEHILCDQTIARPQLSITQENATVRLTWNLQSTPMESIQNYEIYAYKQNATATASDWKKIGSVKSMRLPMAVTLKEFQSNSHYAFTVRAVSIHNRIGPFCEPKTIFTGITPVQPLHTSQLLNVSS